MDQDQNQDKWWSVWFPFLACQLQMFHVIAYPKASRSIVWSMPGDKVIFDSIPRPTSINAIVH